MEAVELCAEAEGIPPGAHVIRRENFIAGGDVGGIPVQAGCGIGAAPLCQQVELVELFFGRAVGVGTGGDVATFLSCCSEGVDPAVADLGSHGAQHNAQAHAVARVHRVGCAVEGDSAVQGKLPAALLADPYAE